MVARSVSVFTSGIILSGVLHEPEGESDKPEIVFVVEEGGTIPFRGKIGEPGNRAHGPVIDRVS